MSDFILGHNDIGYKSTFAGVTWQPDLNDSMLKRELITAVARSLDLSAFNLDITLSVDQPVESLGIINHNLSKTGTYRWRAYSNPARTNLIYDSTTITVGKYYDKMEYQTTCDATGSEISTSYWRLTLSDPSNTYGYFQIGRIFIGQRLYFDKNMDYGLQLGIEETNSDLETSQVGIETFIDVGNKRTATFDFSLLCYNEGNEFLRFSMGNGIIGACLFEFNPDDKQEGLKTFICRQSSLSPLDYSSYNINNFAISLVEIF